MNILDLAICLLIAAAVFRGLSVGLVRQAFGFFGFWGGLALGATLAVQAANRVPLPWKVTAVLVTLSLGIFVGSILGDLLGRFLGRVVKFLRIGLLDSLLGGLLGAGTTLFGIWLLAAVVSLVPAPNLSRTIRQSVIVRQLSDSLPSTPEFIASVGRALAPGAYPRVFAGLAPAPAAPVDPASPAEVQQAVAADQDGVVKIAGLSCGSIDEGSGFIVGEGVVATNAHVVAGVIQPIVYDENGPHDAVTILFDPNTDLALLRVGGLSGKVLSFDSGTISRGTTAAVLGYPKGGPFTGISAGVLREILAEGQNIYGTGVTTRHVYELQSAIEPGNSGGPIVLADGRVIGMVFARSDADSGVGYALTVSQIESEITAGMGGTQEVDTQRCVSE